MRVRKQGGMSLIGFLIVLSMVVFFVYLGMRITPIYLEYYSVVSAMDGISKEPGSARYTPFELKDKFLNRLWVSYSNNNVKAENVKIVRNNGVQIRVQYEVRKPVIGNLDVVASFDRTAQLSN
ncbi:DUF4845 domain-containing protein [Marinihelvus fidelis]|uniref:DUF4845 domain-containing protein n=1 Tax=Marinihelvus fidelis TaxID=2613842 RepID=A0A5N0TFM3_9GAMM|nr:DUF4845 domain-containing protein [Marinihelvus fidelis]KAA9133274.1 DUF4845 domain-containing protein [Marinihelvus fidelis]